MWRDKRLQPEAAAAQRERERGRQGGREAERTGRGEVLCHREPI